MLTHLRIQGLAVIESLTIEFSPIFNVITGETGAGKSILIKALGLMFGSKASGDVVRAGFDQADVSGRYEIPLTHGAVAVLDRLGVPYDEEDKKASVLLRRQITAKGKSHAWINDVPVTTGSLRELGYVLIDIFGQFENQRLLNPQEHLHYVDEFLAKKEAQEVYAKLYQQAFELHESLRADLEDFRTKLKDQDYLRFRYEEVSTFQPEAADYARVSDLCHRAKGALTRQERLQRLVDVLDASVDGQPASKAVHEAAQLLKEIGKTDKRFEALAAECDELASRLDDVSYEIGRLARDDDLEEAAVEEAQSRLAGYQGLFRKFAASSIEELMVACEKLEQDLSFVDNFSLDVKERLGKLRGFSGALTTAAAELTAERKKAGEKIKKRLVTELKELNLKDARFDVEFLPSTQTWEALDLAGLGAEFSDLYAVAMDELSELGRSGAERAQFLFSANPGEPLRPLHKIASGGEISRIMLALKKSLAAGAETCVLVFDEIDAGISGRAADIVGRKMKELSRGFQVVCISHLAQVAAYADQHFLVEKTVKGSRTESRIVKLSRADSEKEIARLLSGTEITGQSLANAKELLAKARAL